MSKWPWQKWIGKLVPFVIAVGSALWKVLSDEPGWEPSWWVTASAALTTIVQWVMALFPAKEE